MMIPIVGAVTGQLDEVTRTTGGWTDVVCYTLSNGKSILLYEHFFSHISKLYRCADVYRKFDLLSGHLTIGK